MELLFKHPRTDTSALRGCLKVRSVCNVCVYGRGAYTWEVANRIKTAEKRAARRLERRQFCQPHLRTAVLT